MKLHEISVKRPVAVIMAILVMVVIGFYSITMLPMDMMPEMDMSMALIFTTYGNVGSEEVENLVTKNIESAVGTVSGVKQMTSQSSQGSSIVMVEFATGTDMDTAISDMRGKIDLMSSFLPDDVDKPTILKLDTSMMATAMMSASYEGYDLIQTKRFLDDNLVSKLEAVDGVASVNITGAQDREIQVIVDPQKLFGYNMNLGDVVAAVAAQNKNMPAGSTNGMGKDLSARLLGKFKDVKDIDVVPITTPTGQVIYLRDIASVKDTFSDETTISRLNNENAISIIINAESDANTVDVVDGVNEVLEQTQKDYPKFTYNMTMEQASYIKNAISSVVDNAVLGALLAIMILLLFLGSFRTSLVIGVSMPVSIVTTFIGMYFSGMTINVVSLGGLALGVGMLVDNSVVVLENIFRRRNTFKEDAATASISGAGEVVGAVIASVLTTCIVYVPILFIDNIMAVMFKQLAFTIIFSQTASLITTFLIIPMALSKIKDAEKPNVHLSFVLKPFDRFMNVMYREYEKGLRWVLKNKKKFIIIVMGIFVLSLFALGLQGMTLMPDTDEGTLTVSLELPAGSQLEDSNKLTEQAEKIIEENPSVKTVFSTVGSGGMMSSLGGTSGNQSTIMVTLKDKRSGKTTTEVLNEIRESLSKLAGAEITLEASNTAMQTSSDEVSFQFTGSDDEKLEKYVLEAEKVLAGVDGVTETETSISDTKYEVSVKLNPNKAAQYGMNTTTVSTMVKNVLDGATASRYTEGGSEYDIIVQYPENYVNDYNELKNLQLKSPTGQWVTLADIADVKVVQGSTTLLRIDQKRVITLTGKLFGTNMGKATKSFEADLKKVQTPDGVGRSASGSYKMMMDAMKSLFVAILLGILLMYMVMAAQFENYLQPFIILFTVPLAMIGVVSALVISRSPLSVVGCIGILMLIGIIVNNAIVLIDFINTARRENPEKERTDLIVYSGITRMRPILMTSLTSILGFLPMAISKASGSEMMQPLAVVLLGGLCIGTLLTLFVIPAIYADFDDKKIKRQLKKQKKTEKILAETV